MATQHAIHDVSEDEWLSVDEPPHHPPRRRRRLRRRLRVHSILHARNPHASQYPPLLPLLPFVQPPPTPRWQFFLPELPRPSWSLVSKVVLMSIAFAFAMKALSTTLNLVIQVFGNLVNKLSEINPAKVIGAIMSPIGAIPVTDMWCKTVRIGCGPDRDAAFRTETFVNLKRPHPSEQISIGTDYFACLDDLRILRQQEFATSHLITLAGKVMQFEHILAAPEDLSNNVDMLAKTWKDILLKANTARVSGTNGVGKIIDEFPRLLDGSSNVTLAKVSSGLSPARDDFAAAKSSILMSAQDVKKAKELATVVSRQAHREINRLRKVRNDEERGWAYLAYGWTEFSWPYFQPGWAGEKQHSKEAGQFLGEMIKVVDESDTPMTRNEMSLQQCVIDIADFSHQLDRDFSLEEPSETLSIGDQLTKLAPRIESLQSKLNELKRKDQVARLTLAGVPPLSLLYAGSRSSLEQESAEQAREQGRGPQCPAGLV